MGKDLNLAGVIGLYSRRNLEKVLKETVGREVWRHYRQVLKKAAAHAEKAFLVGLAEGQAGSPPPIMEGLSALLLGSDHPQELEAVLSFVSEACLTGYKVGVMATDGGTADGKRS